MNHYLNKFCFSWTQHERRRTSTLHQCRIKLVNKKNIKILLLFILLELMIQISNNFAGSHVRQRTTKMVLYFQVSARTIKITKTKTTSIFRQSRWNKDILLRNECRANTPTVTKPNRIYNYHAFQKIHTINSFTRSCCDGVSLSATNIPKLLSFHPIAIQSKFFQTINLVEEDNDESIPRQSIKPNTINYPYQNTTTTDTTDTVATTTTNVTPIDSFSSIQYTITSNGWKIIDWSTIPTTNCIVSSSSPVDIVKIRNRIVYIKRDDLLQLCSSSSTSSSTSSSISATTSGSTSTTSATIGISGNKARKFYSLYNLVGTSEFPSCIVSYGGPQSNAMIALASIVQHHNEISMNHNRRNDIVNTDIDNDMEDSLSRQQQEQQPPKIKKCRFVYYTKTIPSYLKEQPSGNYLRAIRLGIEFIELTVDEYNCKFASTTATISNEVSSINYDSMLSSTILQKLVPPIINDSVFIPQGGACSIAEQGCTMLGKEIYDYWYKINNNTVVTGKSSRQQPLTVCIPGGTCTTGLLVHRAIQSLQRLSIDKQQQVLVPTLDIQVVVIPCVGDDVYAKQQMIQLNNQLKSVLSTLSSSSSYCIDDGMILNDIPYVLPSTPFIAQSSSSTNINHISYKKKQQSRSTKYLRFGQLSSEILQTYYEMKHQYNISLDLLYGASAWSILFRHWNTTAAAASVNSSGSSSISSSNEIELLYNLPTSKIDLSCSDQRTSTTGSNIDSTGSTSPLLGRHIMYIHSGGLEGIESQLLRYKHKNMV